MPIACPLPGCPLLAAARPCEFQQLSIHVSACILTRAHTRARKCLATSSENNGFVVFAGGCAINMPVMLEFKLLM